MLVTGCGRSGTRFTSLLLRRLGLDVPHERLGRDGIAAWTLAVHAPERPWARGATDVDFEHVFHQVRHPLEVIASAASFRSGSWDFVCAHTSASPDEPVLVRGARYWLEWNLHAERIATWQYRVEELEAVFAELCGRLGVAADRTVLARLATDVNTRRRGRAFHYYDAAAARLGVARPAGLDRALRRRAPAATRLRWQELAERDERLADAVRSKAAEYGYDV